MAFPAPKNAAKVPNIGGCYVLLPIVVLIVDPAPFTSTRDCGWTARAFSRIWPRTLLAALKVKPRWVFSLWGGL